MSKQKHKPNHLAHYRKRMRYTLRQATRLVGSRDHSVLGALEQGRNLPRLATALKLAILYRVPVEFLYQDLFVELRSKIRHEEHSFLSQQDVLPPEPL